MAKQKETLIAAIDARGSVKGSKTFNKSQKSMQKSTNKTASIMKKMGKIATIAFAFKIAVKGIKMMIAAVSEQERTLALLNSQLKATDSISGQTMDSLTRFSAEMQELTAISNEQVEAGQALLLSFTNIREEGFERTMKVAADMSAVMGTDLKSSLIQVGKALNDPAANLSALSRSGIQFSIVQKKMIKDFVAQNELAKAQAIIFKELERQFGGAAEAGRDTLGGELQALNENFSDLVKNIGEILAPAMKEAVGVINTSVKQTGNFVKVLGMMMEISEEEWQRGLDLVEEQKKLEKTKADARRKERAESISKGVLPADIMTAGVSAAAKGIGPLQEQIKLLERERELVYLSNEQKAHRIKMWNLEAEALKRVADELQKSGLRGTEFNAAMGIGVDMVNEWMGELEKANQVLKDQVLQFDAVNEVAEPLDKVIDRLEAEAEALKEGTTAAMQKFQVNMALADSEERLTQALESRGFKQNEINKIIMQQREVTRGQITDIQNLTTTIDALKNQETVLTRLKSAWDSIRGTVSDALTDWALGAKKTKADWADLWDTIRRILVQRAITAALTPSAAPVAGVAPALKLADGGMVSSPTPALIGEDGPEAVVPLTRDSSGKLGIASAGGGGGGTTIQIISPDARGIQQTLLRDPKFQWLMNQNAAQGYSGV